MKLIDADLFKENIRSGLYVFCQENKEDICNAIDCEPTIERPQGEWKYKDYDFYCSICNESALELNDYPYLSEYCPKCGAKMKGVPDNG